MRWKDARKSKNIDDRRRQTSSQTSRRTVGVGGGEGSPFLRLLPLLLRGKTGVFLFLLIIGAGYLGVDLTFLVGGNDSIGYQNNLDHQSQINRTITPEEEEMAQFTAAALGLTEDLWRQQFNSLGGYYEEPTLVLYTAHTSTACGYGQSAMGPFYCPTGKKIYIDLSFYQDMKHSLGGGGDFAQGYVVAHEVGHHVQNLLGINAEVRKAQQGQSQSMQNQLSVRMELQADCFAGMWGKFVADKGLLDTGDLRKAMDTAAAIGDDRLQKKTQGRVVPDSFTHGTSEQRQRWFMKGYSGELRGMLRGELGSEAANHLLEVCDTFSVKVL